MTRYPPGRIGDCPLTEDAVRAENLKQGYTHWSSNPRPNSIDSLLNILRWITLPLRLLLRGAGWFLGNSKNRKRFWITCTAVMISSVVVAELTLAPRHLPWRPLDVDDRAGFATDFKLRALRLGPESWCEALVSRSSTLEAQAAPPKVDQGDCGWSSAFRVAASGTSIIIGSPPTMRCGLAVGAHIWLTSVNHRAQLLLGSPLKRVHHAGTYSCRRMYNRSSGRMSQHAYANAWDVTGFELADGRVVSVLRDWSSKGPRRDFLKRIRDDACNVFDVVLGPDFNAAHRDHFHLDMGHGVRCK